jgi:hypothetical protein
VNNSLGSGALSCSPGGFRRYGLIIIFHMLPQVCDRRLGSYHEKVVARNSKSSQRPNDETLDKVGDERRCCK